MEKGPFKTNTSLWSVALGAALLRCYGVFVFGVGGGICIHSWKSLENLGSSGLPGAAVVCYVVCINLSKRVTFMQTVLIADPSEIFADALAGMLREDHRVHICHTGEEALRLLEELRPGALVIDLTLPILDGFDVLRATAYTPPVILATTNLASVSVLTAAEAVGIKALFRKPSKPSAVAECLCRLMVSA